MTEARLLLGTENGVQVLHRDGAAWQVAHKGLGGHRVWAVACHPGAEGVYFGGTYGGGLYRSVDGGQSWHSSDEGLRHRYIRTIVFNPRSPQTVYVGTEPAAMFRSDDGGSTWRELERIQDLPGADDWFLPYSPRRGAMRSIVVVASAPEVVYGGIEQGGVILSRDGGESWQLLGGGVHPDVHQLAISPANPSHLFAATGGGLYRSDDGGRSWIRLIERYTRAVWLDPSNPERVWAGPADYVGRRGTIVRSDDRGVVWQEATEGLHVPMPDMVETFAGPLDRALLAVTSGGSLICTALERPCWQELLLLPGEHVTTAALA